MCQTTQYLLQFLCLIGDLQQLYQKAERTKTQAQQKEMESKLHVIDAEAVISIKREKDSYLPRK